MKLLRCIEGNGGDVRTGKVYISYGTDRQYHYLRANDSGSGWNKGRFEILIEDEDFEKDYPLVEILEGNGLSVNKQTLFDIKNIEYHFLQDLDRLGYRKIGGSKSEWKIALLEKPESFYWVKNPVAASLLIGNVEAKAKLGLEITIINELNKNSKSQQSGESAVSMTERKKIAMEAIRVLPNNKSYVFGGFVRDHLAGDDFKDIDVYVPGTYGRQDYIEYLKGNGFRVVHARSGKAYNLGPGMKHEVYVISKNGHEVTLDIIADPEGYNSPVPAGNWDADINQVLMRKDGSIGVGFGNKSTLEQIKEKILKKEYTPLAGLKIQRETKLAQKGYYATGIKRPETPKTEEKGSNNVEKQTQAQTTATPAKPSFMDKLKVNAEDAAYRVAATQMTNGTKAAILAIMQKQGQGSERIAAISEMLDTEVGSALVAGLLGLGLQYAPMVSEDPRAQRLADEFQVAGMATVGNAVVGLAMEHFVPVVMGALASLPEPTKQMRVASSEESKVLSVPPIELEDNSAVQQKAAAAVR